MVQEADSHSPACHVLTTVPPWNHEQIKIAYQPVVTFGHITFGRTARVLSILTRPLHSQRAVATEGVDQAGWNKGEGSEDDKIYVSQISPVK